MVNIVDPEVEGTVEDFNEVEVEEVETPEVEYELPEKFRGKSQKDIVDMYSNLEKELGRKGQEVGELRKLADEFLRSKVNQQEPEPEEDVDFYEDPKKAVEQLLKKDPRLKEVETQAAAMKAQAAMQKLQSTHPDFMDVVQDTAFQDWVKGSKIRMQLFQQADSYDFDAANELLSTWKERSMINKTKEAEAEQEADRKAALKGAKSESRSSGEAKAGKKIYRRADLIRLKQTDPNRYETLQDEILAAYAEGRVK
jgi:hypothetical protein